MSDARAMRDHLLARLVALWEGGGGYFVMEYGARVPRREVEAELIQALRPACYAVAQESKAPKRGKAKKDARPSKPKADPS